MPNQGRDDDRRACGGIQYNITRTYTSIRFVCQEPSNLALYSATMTAVNTSSGTPTEARPLSVVSTTAMDVVIGEFWLAHDLARTK